MKFMIVFLSIIQFSCNNSNLQKDEDKNSLLIGTFNIEWLGDGFDDKNPRNDEDYTNIAKVIEDSGAELLALQEVENIESLKRILKYLPNWNYIFSNEESNQNNCYLFKSYLSLQDNGTFDDLQIDGFATRKGAVAKLKYGNLELILLNVHLKSTSSYDNTEEKKQLSYKLRRKQSIKIVEFKDSILRNNIANSIVVLGDFNDNPLRNEKSNILKLDSNFFFVTKGLESCKSQYYDLIDHIIISENLIDNLEPVSAYVYDFATVLTKSQVDKVSDHCPVIVRINVD